MITIASLGKMIRRIGQRNLTPIVFLIYNNASMEIVLTVSQCVEAINIALDSLGGLTVEGEVSEFRILQNKWVTFDIKDDTSVLKCFMTVWNLRTQIEDGMLVKVSGKPNVRNKGFLSFVVQQVTPSGEGNLKRAFQLLQQKLTAEGLFAPERKRALPRFPEHIALITSKDAAAYNDFLKVLSARQGGLTISFVHTMVQGAEAPQQIISALATANELPDLDAIVLVRGGGSMEDLIAFNDEHVVRAVASSRTPTIVGIGHERDVCLAELAADVRASTPSNAAELLVRSREEIARALLHMQSSLVNRIRSQIADDRRTVIHMTHAMTSRLKGVSQRAHTLISRMTGGISRMKDAVTASAKRIEGMRRMLLALSPEHTLARGYSITTAQNGRVLKRAEDAKAGEEITTRLADGSISSVVRKSGS